MLDARTKYSELPEAKKKRYKKDPFLFIKEVLGIKLDVPQENIINACLEDRKIAIAGSAGCGKSCAIISYLLWMSTCNEPCKTMVFYPTMGQAKSVFGGEIQVLFDGAKYNLECKVSSSGAVQFENGSDVSILSFNTIKKGNTRSYGRHSRNWHLVYADEMQTITREMAMAFDDIATSKNSKVICSGNPLKEETEFHKMFAKDSEYRGVSISIKDTINFIEGREVIPGLSGREYEERMRKTYGELSDIYVNRCLGEFAKLSSANYVEGDAIVPYDMVKNAMERQRVKKVKEDDPMLKYLNPVLYDKRWGIDPAGFLGENSTVIVERDGLRARKLKEWQTAGVGEIANWVINAWKAEEHKPEICIDYGGVGDGLVSLLMADPDIAPFVRAIYTGTTSDYKERYYNIKAEGYFNMRTWIAYAKIEHDKSFYEIATITYHPDNRGRLTIESKSDRNNAGKTTDTAEALLQTFLSRYAKQNSVITGKLKTYTFNT